MISTKYLNSIAYNTLMGEFQELNDAARKKLQIADHMLTMSYPMIKDPRLLLSILENLFLALSYGMSSLLYYEKDFKRISSFPNNFADKLEMFRAACSVRYGLGNEGIKAMQEIKEILVAYRKSPVEFPRKESLIICDGNYQMKIISASMVRGYLEKAKLFITSISSIISRNKLIYI